MGYWSIVEPVWDAIDIYSGPDVFMQTFGSVPRASGLLFAAHFCQSEICNGGFQQFFGNSTGVLAAEAVEGFHEIGQHQVAALIEKAMSLFGSGYPRDRKERETRLEEVCPDFCVNDQVLFFGDGVWGRGAVPLPQPISVEMGCAFIA
jgi:hypothetical protein